MATRLLVWLVERCAEWLLAALLLLVYSSLVYEDNLDDGLRLLAEVLNLKDLWFALLMLLGFYIMSGYLFSTVYFGIWRRRPQPRRQISVLVPVFFGHYAFFMVLFTEPGDFLLWPMGVLGACIVAVTTLAGSALLKRWSASQPSSKE